MTTPVSPATTRARTPAPAGWTAWRAARDAELADPHGWLSLTALHWLTASPGSLEDLPGRWWAEASGIHVEPSADGEPLTLDGAPLTATTTVWTSTEGAAGDLRHGDRVLEPIGRGPLNHGVRVRDPHAPALTAFTGVPAFDHDPAWRLTATFEPAAAGRVTETGSVAVRVTHVQDVAGHLRFTHAGAEHVLEVSGGAHPAVWFRDATNGVETAAFRVVPLAPGALAGEHAGGDAPGDPHAAGTTGAGADDAVPTVVLDLNRAQNAPCAFSDHGTCPLPPAGNTLPFAVRAGERRPVGR